MQPAPQKPSDSSATTPKIADQLTVPIDLPEISNSNKRILYILLSIVILAAAAGIVYWLFHTPAKKTNQPAAAASVQTQASGNNTPAVAGVQLNPVKNYGNKYAGGILPVGDGKYQTANAKTGYIYACAGYAQNLQNSPGGASKRGPWFVGTTQYDVSKKLHVQGSVMWQASFSNKVSGHTRSIITNDLPNHPTGVFPISPTDPSYAYDRNPNLITEQTFDYALNANPGYGDPQCMGGQAGLMLTGVALFNAFDAGGRDAGAWEIQDSCSGHPEKDGIYHYHTLSSCIKDVSAKTVIGFALDGFPITGPQVGTDNILTTSDLDECHGLTSQIILDGKEVTTYHYVMTQDFPYSVSCFRSTPIQPPGQTAH